MTMRRVITIACAAAAFGVAHADDLKIAAGEHGEYSRVVVPGGAREVVVDAASRLVDIRLSQEEAAVDLSDITGKHKAFRIADAATLAEGDSVIVRLSLKCACRVDTVNLQSGKTVIDISDHENGAASSENRAAAATSGANAGTNAGANESLGEGESELSVAEARRRMRDLLQRAADEGFVSMRGAEQAALETPLSESQSANPPSKAPKDKSPAGPPPAAPKSVAACQPDAAFAIEGGDFDRDPLGEIAKFRTLMEEAPEDEKRAATDEFARGYLAVGFGEEALALLTDIGQQDSLLADMARAVAELPISEDGALTNAVDCKGAHALWQAAAAEPELAAQKARHSGDAVEALPKRLRTLLAARIAKKAIEAGAWRTAERFHKVVAEYSEYAKSDFKYIEARLIEHGGGAAEAEEMLQEVAAGDSQASQDALIALAERYAAEGASPDENFVEDLGALATRAKGSAKGGEAALHEAMIWTAAGNIEAGVFLLRSAVESDSSLAEVASLESARAVSAAFDSEDKAQRFSALRALLVYRALIERDGPAPLMRVKAAETALDIGLPNLALQLLDGAGDSGERATILLKARAALQASANETALASAAPYADDPEFAAIVVTANLQLERNYAALAAASALSDEEQKAEAMALAAWRAGDYASATRAYRKISPNSLSVENAVHFALSAYMAGESEIPPAAEAVLQRAEKETLDGFKSLFGENVGGAIAARGRALANSAGDEIELVREILGHG